MDSGTPIGAMAYAMELEATCARLKRDRAELLAALKALADVADEHVECADEVERAMEVIKRAEQP